MVIGIELKIENPLMQVLLGEEPPKLAGRGASRTSLDTYDLLERVAAAQAPFWPGLVRPRSLACRLH